MGNEGRNEGGRLAWEREQMKTGGILNDEEPS